VREPLLRAGAGDGQPQGLPLHRTMNRASRGGGAGPRDISRNPDTLPARLRQGGLRFWICSGLLALGLSLADERVFIVVADRLVSNAKVDVVGGLVCHIREKRTVLPA